MATVSVDSIDISCNWKIINEKPLANAVTVFDSASNFNFDDLVTLDSCIALSQNDVTDLLEVAINVVNPKLTIKEICIVSEARLLELYGKFGEYDGTTAAVNTEDGDEDMQVFRAKLTLKNPSPHCSIKFAGVAKDKKEMWVLGLGIILQEATSPEVVDSLASRVGKILQESRVPLTENAENCKKIVLSQHELRPSCLEVEMKQYVDKMCGDLETKLKSHMDEKFNALEESINKRLDSILSKIG